MRNTLDDDVAALERVTADLVEALAGFDKGDWDLPTPCSDWNLAGLVDHVTGGNWYTLQILAGEESDDALAAAKTRFAGGSVSGPTAIQSALDQLEAFKGAGALDRSWHHVAGELTGRQMLRLRNHDLIVHTWDINESRQPPATISISLAEWGLLELRDAESLTSNHFDLPSVPGGQLGGDVAVLTYLRSLGRVADNGETEPARQSRNR